VIGGRSEYGFSLPGATPADPHAPALNAEHPVPDEVDALVDESTDGFIPISDDIAAVIEQAADQAADFISFREEIQKLVTTWSPDKIAECIAIATFKARALGSAKFNRE
jgi:hypothetical protein